MLSLDKSSLFMLLALFVPFVLPQPSVEAQTAGWSPVEGTTDGFEIAGNYGTLGVASSTNYPGGRTQAMNWTDKSGNFWLLGGEVSTGGNTGDYLANDLWMYTPPSGTSRSGTWTWVGGSSDLTCVTYSLNCVQGEGVYGVQGTASAANVPGVRYGGSTWVDPNGDFWLFGGAGIDGSGAGALLNDLWKFDPVARQWTWMNGPATASGNRSGGEGNAGVYGTLGVAAAANVPGARYDATHWTDTQGNLWLFGGTGIDGGDFGATLNDLWEFAPSTGMWRWVSGSSVVGPLLTTAPAVLGTKGAEAPSNTPGSIAGGPGFTDTAGNLWLFGAGNLWRFDIAKSQWAWVTGAGQPYCPLDPFVNLNACISRPPVAKALGVADPANDPAGDPSTNPESTVPAASWVDSAGNFWMFGNTGPDITGENNGFHVGLTTPLWMFNPTTTQWTWMSGDLATSNCSFTLLAPIPVVVCQGSSGLTDSLYGYTSWDSPGARANASSWVDTKGNLWLFGGLSPSLGTRNDLWEFEPSPGSLPPAATPIFSLKPGIYVSDGPLTIANGMPNASFYYTTDGTLPTTSSPLYNGPIDLYSTLVFMRAIAVAPGYSNSALATELYYFGPNSDGVGFTPPPAAYSSPVTVYLEDDTPGTTIYYTLDGTTPTDHSLMYGAPITVSATETINAIAYTNDQGVLDGIATTGSTVVSGVSAGGYAIAGGPAAPPTFNPVAESSSTPINVVLSDVVPGATIYYTLDGSVPTTASAVYAGPITPTLNAITTIKAIAASSSYPQSAVASATYAIGTIRATPPVFSVPAGTYTSAQVVTITDATPGGATIYYTTNGSTPTAASSVYTGPITISTSSTLQAIALAPNPYTVSTVTAASYVINLMTLQPAFTLQALPNSLTVTAGNTGTVSLTVTPQNGFNAAVTFACSGLPTASSCSFNPATVVPSGASASTVMTISTSSQSVALEPISRPYLSLIALPSALLLFVRRRRPVRYKLLLALVFMGLGSIVGCGGNVSSGTSGGGTTPVTTTVTVTATGAAMQQTTSVLLTLN